VTAVAGLALATAPNLADFLPFFQPLLPGRLATGIATVFAPAVIAILFTSLALALLCCKIEHSASRTRSSTDPSLGVAHMHGSVSISGGQRFIFKVTFFIITMAAVWLVLVGALLFAVRAFTIDVGISKSIANGSVYMSTLALSIIVVLAFIFPALLLLQPSRLWRVLREERHAITPRHLFRGPSFFTSSLKPLTLA